MNEAYTLQIFFSDFEYSSSLSINLQKFEIYFSKNTNEQTKEEISETLGVTECLEIGKYLGMSSMIGRKKKSVFGYLRDTIWRKIQQWSRRFLKLEDNYTP